MAAGLVGLVNSSTRDASAIIDDALAAGSILGDAGPAPYGDGQVQYILDSDMEAQRLLAKQAAREEESQQLQLAAAQASYQAAMLERQKADVIRRNTATLKRVRAMG